jgi:hypothetical protein
VRRAARDELRKGAHCIKVMASGGVASPTDRRAAAVLCAAACGADCTACKQMLKALCLAVATPSLPRPARSADGSPSEAGLPR